MSSRENRRAFLVKGLAATVGAMFLPFVSVSANNANTLTARPTTSKNAAVQATSQVFEVAIRSNLFDEPKRLELVPGVPSNAVDLDSGTFRVVVSRSEAHSVFGQVYELALLDAKMRKLDQMNVGSNTTATFRRYGVQVYVLSIQR